MCVDNGITARLHTTSNGISEWVAVGAGVRKLNGGERKRGDTAAAE